MFQAMLSSESGRAKVNAFIVFGTFFGPMSAMSIKYTVYTKTHMFNTEYRRLCILDTETDRLCPCVTYYVHYMCIMGVTWVYRFNNI